MGAVGPVEGLPDRGGDDGVLAAGDGREGVPDPVNAAALRGFKDPGDGRLEPCAGVADRQPDPARAP
jgi:hypothetical protein